MTRLMAAKEYNEFKARKRTKKGAKVVEGQKGDKVSLNKRKQSAGANKIEFMLKASGLEFVKEYKFHPVRKFRFDFYLPQFQVAIEYEGIISDYSRHTSIIGYTKDCEKYNLALSLGIKPYRYTTRNVGQVRDLLKQLADG